MQETSWKCTECTAYNKAGATLLQNATNATQTHHSSTQHYVTYSNGLETVNLQVLSCSHGHCGFTAIAAKFLLCFCHTAEKTSPSTAAHSKSFACVTVTGLFLLPYRASQVEEGRYNRLFFSEWCTSRGVSRLTAFLLLSQETEQSIILYYNWTSNESC